MRIKRIGYYASYITSCLNSAGICDCDVWVRKHGIIDAKMTMQTISETIEKRGTLKGNKSQKSFTKYDELFFCIL